MYRYAWHMGFEDQHCTLYCIHNSMHYCLTGMRESMLLILLLLMVHLPLSTQTRLGTVLMRFGSCQ